MKLRRNMFLEVSTDKTSGINRISGMEFSKNTLFNKALKDNYTDTFLNTTLNIKDFEINIRDKNLYIL